VTHARGLLFVFLAPPMVTATGWEKHKRRYHFPIHSSFSDYFCWIGTQLFPKLRSTRHTPLGQDCICGQEHASIFRFRFVPRDVSVRVFVFSVWPDIGTQSTSAVLNSSLQRLFALPWAQCWTAIVGTCMRAKWMYCRVNPLELIRRGIVIFRLRFFVSVIHKHI
jgi:hypothetical protein